MNFLNNLAENLTRIWSESTSAARVGIGLLTAICLFAIIAVGYWSAMPSYVTLLSDVGHEKIAKVVDGLESAGIKYQIGGAGGVLRVEKNDFAKAQNIARAQGVESIQSSSQGMGDVFLSPSDRKTLEVRKKEQSLASTIKKFHSVDSADVHLNIPINGPFERKRKKASASVLITLRPGERLSSEQALSIASLVAFAVEDLDPEHVKITDKDGRVYAIEDELQGSINSQMGFKVENENQLARKAQMQLNRLVGYGNASVQVSLDLTFTHGSKKVVKYDPDGKVAEQEDINTEKTNQDLDGVGGVAGVAGNLGNQNQGEDKTLKNFTESLKTSYLVPKTEETETNSTPVRNFMTVSVIVNSDADGIKDENGELIAGIEDKVEGIVKSAVGFKDEVDKISLEFLSFPTNEVEAIPAAPIDWLQISRILQDVSLAVAAIASLLFGFMALRKFKPPASTGESPSTPLTESPGLVQFRNLARDDPELVAKILKNWMDSKAGEPASSANSKKAA